MATIDISKNHTLGAAEAKKRAEKIIEGLKGDGIQGNWSGNTFNITKPATGSLDVTDSAVRIQVDLPFMLRPLKGKIEERINKALQTLDAPA